VAAVSCARFTTSGSIRRGLAMPKLYHGSSHLESALELMDEMSRLYTNVAFMHKIFAVFARMSHA
jgi:hypothetical protein